MFSLALPILLAAAAGLAFGSAAASADDARLVRYGAHLAQECTSCHRRDGVDNGIPSILGQTPEQFVEALKYYQSGQRTNPVMVSVARSLDEEQMRALAAFFATLPKPPKR
jgi:cytochrome c